MVDLSRRVTRRATRTFANGKPIVVSLLPGDVVELRLYRCREGITATLSDLYKTVARWHADAELARKRAEKRERKKLGA